MTAANAWVDRDAAYILMDRGSFHADGRLLYTSTKYGTHDRLRFAFAHAGIGHADLVADLGEVFDRFPDQAYLLAAMPEVIAATVRMFEEAASSGVDMSGHVDPPFHMLLSLWSFADLEPQAYAIGSQPGSIAGPIPYTLRRVRSCCSPPVPPEAPHPSDRTFRAKGDARRMIEGQRRYRDEGGAIRVAGGADLVTVDASGIRVTDLCTWPDRIGEMVSG